MYNLPKIKVIGIGGAGCKAVDKLLKRNIPNIQYCVVDSDYNSLKISKCENKLQIPCESHKGGDYEYSSRIVSDSRQMLADAVNGADMLVLIAGLGGGIGSAATPIIAEIAKNQNILTAAAVYLPFEFEGKTRLSNAERGLRQLRENAVIIRVPCEKMQTLLPDDAPISHAFELADNFLYGAVCGLIAPLVEQSAVNLAFDDLKPFLAKATEAEIGLGISEGKDRTVQAVRYAVNCPTFNRAIEEADGVIIYVEGGDDFTLEEMNEIANYIRLVLKADAYIYFGVSMS